VPTMAEREKVAVAMAPRTVADVKATTLRITVLLAVVGLPSCSDPWSERLLLGAAV
jgi:hypothetical protein